MQTWNHPSRPGHSIVAWAFYVVALGALVGFLLVPYSEIWIYPSWDEDLGSNGWQLLHEAWAVVAEPPGPFAIGFTVSIAFGLLTAFSIICVLPAAAMLWFAGHSRVILWLGRIWWSLLVLPGFAWFFLVENAIRSPGTIDYLHREGMVLYWVGGLGIALAFWMTGRTDRSMEVRMPAAE
jgi:hypothetical protein